MDTYLVGGFNPWKIVVKFFSSFPQIEIKHLTNVCHQLDWLVLNPQPIAHLLVI